MQAVVWSKDSCPFCVQAKALLESKGIKFEERNVSKDWTREQLLAAVTNARTSVSYTHLTLPTNREV